MVQSMIAGGLLDYLRIMLFILLLQLSICRGISSGEATLCTLNACFTFHREQVSFEDALSECKDNGGYLATTKGKREEAELQSIISQIDERHRRLDFDFWIGLKLPKGHCVVPDVSLKGFKWISESEPSEYSNWKKEPNATCTEDRCVFVHYFLSSREELKWTDGSCKRKAFYACKFYFKGMCKPLVLAGGEQVNYILPFSANPLNENNKLTAFPYGTYAEITCSGNVQTSICNLMDGFYSWTSPGPFCASGKPSCGYKNGGCDQLCLDGDDGDVSCGCKDGYVLDPDRKSCSLKDYCYRSPCQHQCVSGLTGFSCVCPNGFQLDEKGFGCIDVDECQNNSCDGHDCINTQGSFTCKCKDGYKMVEGKCRDIDECIEPRSRCHQKCRNSQGSYSCHCIAGFTLSKEGHTCVDIDECLSNPCEDNCTNTIGSFRCSCHRNFRFHPNGITCIPDVNVLPTAESSSAGQQNETTDFITITTDGLTSSKPLGTSGSLHNDNVFSSWTFICVIASVVPLLLVIVVTSGIVIFRCRRSKRAARKKILTADSYCWVASGLEKQLAKCDRSHESTA
ncbi:complement component C1q receptor [Esox lucius]|uniref:Complement component C1q receptor-like n=1 Tax=Esox lucius TaxID=8010 RepID=A0AAY5KFC2_ESOLU|nr:complement component C1q receptor [Esox lucius]